ncbi:MAG: M61 family metallopeptidase, partial [Leptospiraceae bacterium]|nr:M61 family metallopeptidase [Leptospiraceae bacterium]
MNSPKNKKKATPRIQFIISSKDPHLHYFEVEMKIDLKQEKTILRLPTWSPGSYVIRDYSGHLHLFEAFRGKKHLNWKQIDLSSWEIENNKKSFSVKYKIYAFECTVRTNFLDSEFGFINSPGFFLYPENGLNQEVSVQFKKNTNFPFVYSPILPLANKFIAKDFDELFDSPFQLSSYKSNSFDALGCKHEIIIQGDLNPSIKESILKNLKLITTYQSKQFGKNPNKYYLFILILLEDGYGGLEHRASSVNIYDPIDLDKTADYNRLMGLLCHEYFHLWNIKRIRPIALGPFDYQKPNLTRELWIAEGITSFYDNYFLYKTGIYTRNEYINELLSDYNRLNDNWGEDWMSLEDSSFTTWNKYYKQTINSPNTGISYYIKGALLVLCMDIFILEKTNTKHSFFDIMKFLYSHFYVKLGRGFTKEEFFESAEKVTGVNLKKHFEEYLSTPKRLPIQDYLNKIEVKIAKTQNKGAFPFETKTISGKEIVKRVKQHKMKNIDINLGDEIIAINDRRVSKESLEKWKNHSKEDEVLEILISRRGKILKRTLKCKIQYLYQQEFNGNQDEAIQKNQIAKKFF